MTPDSGTTSSRPVRAVVFDLFETLITEIRQPDAPTPRWGMLTRELGLDRDAFQEAWRALQHRRMTSPVTYRDGLAQLCRDLGTDPPANLIQELDQLRAADKRRCFAELDPDVLAMLSAVKGSGVPIAILSNCCVDELDGYSDSGLAELVDLAIWSFEIGVAKPDRAVYEGACRKLGVKPSDSLFVGDGSFGELDGAARAGLRPLWATWFVERWPAHLAEPRIATLQHQQHTRLRHPGELLHVLDHA